jgi:hypothetical protein
MKASDKVKIIVAVISAIAIILAAFINIFPDLLKPDKNTVTPSVTEGSQPLARITNLVDGDTVAQLITLMGQYRPDLKDDIWIFVQDPSTRYYAQSMDTNQGSSTPKINGNWEIRIGVGVAESSGVFNLVLTTATTDASKFIADALKNKDFGGFASLPPGVTEIQRLKVVRGRDSGSDSAAAGCKTGRPDHSRANWRRGESRIRRNHFWQRVRSRRWDVCMGTGFHVLRALVSTVV